MANQTRYTGVLHHAEREPRSDDGRDGQWSRSRLEAMNDRFAAAMQREQRQSSQEPAEKKTK
jgi:hypothetical protein